MTTEQAEALRIDFLAWTGGFPPESREQITAYILTAMPYDIEDEGARMVLASWREAAESA